MTVATKKVINKEDVPQLLAEADAESPLQKVPTRKQRTPEEWEQIEKQKNAEMPLRHKTEEQAEKYAKSGDLENLGKLIHNENPTIRLSAAIGIHTAIEKNSESKKLIPWVEKILFESDYTDKSDLALAYGTYAFRGIVDPEEAQVIWNRLHRKVESLPTNESDKIEMIGSFKQIYAPFARKLYEEEEKERRDSDNK
ncbi:MAG: hypothetical protein Q7S22_06885 [Candidatus Micrarchaeota archaeon]|nr:hypothetical protein [Candidatus Micrarchaeota archaeon]